MIKSQNIGEIFRSNRWWNTNIPILLAFLYFTFLSFRIGFENSIISFFTLLFWASSAAAFGFFVNDWSDIKVDAISNKKNLVGNLSSFSRIAILLLLIVSNILPWILLKSNVGISISILHLVAFGLYSSPPFRFKNKLFIGLVLDAIYAFVLPISLTILLSLEFQLVKDPFPKLFLILLVLWSFLAGLRNIIYHHLQDRKNDVISSTKNLYNSIGGFKTVKAHNVILIIESIVFTFLWIPFDLLNWLVPLSFAIYYLDEIFYLTKQNKITTRISSKYNKGLFSINFFYEKRLPFIFLAYLIYLNPYYCFLGILHIILFETNFNRIKYFFVFLFYHSIVFFYHHILLKYSYHYGHKIKKLLGMAKPDKLE